MKINEFAEVYYSMPEEERDINDWYPVLNNYVKYMTNKFRNVIGDFEDKYQIAWIGAIKGIKGFNGTREASFATYITYCIRNEILMYKRKSESYILDRTNSDGKKFEQVSFDSAVKDKENMTVSEVVGEPDLDFSNIDIYDKLERLKAMCTKQQRMILEELMNDKTLSEIAEENGLDKANMSRTRKVLKRKFEQLV